MTTRELFRPVGLYELQLIEFEEHVVGSRIYRELWIPAEELATFNSHIIGQIRIKQVFYGNLYTHERRWHPKD